MHGATYQELNDANARLCAEINGLEYQTTSARHFLMKNFSEVKNEIGGVTGYKLNLNAEQTKKLFSILDKPPLK